MPDKVVHLNRADMLAILMVMNTCIMLAKIQFDDYDDVGVAYKDLMKRIEKELIE